MTWIIFTSATWISLLTYSFNTSFNLIANISNVTATAQNSATLFAIVRYGKNGKSEKRAVALFDWWCLGAAFAILAFWAMTENHLFTHLSMQVLLSVGYFPTLRELWFVGRATESRLVWTLYLLSNMLALYVPVRDNDVLAIVFTGRSIVSIGLVILLLLRLERQAKTKGGASL